MAADYFKNLAHRNSAAAQRADPDLTSKTSTGLQAVDRNDPPG